MDPPPPPELPSPLSLIPIADTLIGKDQDGALDLDQIEAFFRLYRIEERLQWLWLDLLIVYSTARRAATGERMRAAAKAMRENRENK